MLKMIHCVVASILLVLQATNLCTAQDYSSNIALRKMAEQSGMYAGRDASLAVDGYRYSDPNNRHCSTVDTSDPSYRGNKNFAWWQVDLGDIYSVFAVTVFNTDDEPEWRYLYNFTVYVSYGSDVSDAASRSICRWVKPDRTVINGAPDVVRVRRNDSYTVNCTVELNVTSTKWVEQNVTTVLGGQYVKSSTLVGQYVTIKRTGGVTPGKMTLCEVEVEGTRYYSCHNCLGDCSSAGCTECNPGFIPPSCTSRRDGSRNVNTTTYQDGTTNETDTRGGLSQTKSTSTSSTKSKSISGVERLRGSRAAVLGLLILLVVLEITKRRDHW